MARACWYAVHVLSQAEQRVKTFIEKTRVERGMQDKIIDVIIPLDTETKRVQGKKIEKKVKVFPGYVLIRMELDDNTFAFIKRVPGVTNFVSSGANKPVAMKDSEIKSILDSLDPQKTLKPKNKFYKDMIVRIVAGPFSDYTGKIDFIDEDKEMLKVLVPLFGRDTPIEIEFGQVEKVS